MRYALAAKLLLLLTGSLLLQGCPELCACLPGPTLFGTVTGTVMAPDSTPVGGSLVSAEYRAPGCDGALLHLSNEGALAEEDGSYSMYLDSFEAADSLPCYRVRAEAPHGVELRASEWVEFDDQVDDPLGFEATVDLLLRD